MTRADPSAPDIEPERPTKLWNRSFLLLWQGQFVSQIGTQCFTIAMMFWVKHATDSATTMGLLVMVANLPAVLLGPIGGTFADRHSRRGIIIVSDVLNGIAVLALAVLIFLAPEAGGAIIAWLFVVCALAGVVGAFFRPAISASIPDLVPTDRVAAANSLHQSSFQIAGLVGQGLGGVLFRLLGAPLLFLVDGVTYLFSAFSESFITIPQVIPDKTSGWREALAAFKADTVEGFWYVWRRPGLRTLILAASVLNFLVGPVIVLLPFYVEDHLGVGAEWYGFLLAALGGGTMLGYLLAGTLRLPGPVRGWALIGFLIADQLTLASFALVRGPVPALAPAFTAGLLSGFISIHINTILQLTTPTYIRGRVFGLLGTISAGLAPIGMGLAGVVADLANQNIPLIFMVAGSIAALLSVVVAFDGEYRRFLSHERPPEGDTS